MRGSLSFSKILSLKVMLSWNFFSFTIWELGKLRLFYLFMANHRKFRNFSIHRRFPIFQFRAMDKISYNLTIFLCQLPKMRSFTNDPFKWYPLHNLSNLFFQMCFRWNPCSTVQGLELTRNFRLGFWLPQIKFRLPQVHESYLRGLLKLTTS